MTVFARVVFPLPLEQSFLYAVPEAFRAAARPGTRVIAPLGPRRQSGFIVAITTEPPAAGIKLKELLDVLDDRPFRDERFLDFTGRLSEEFRSSWGEILQSALPPSLAGKAKVAVILTEAGREALAQGALGPRAKLLAEALAGARKGRSPLALQRKLGGSGVTGLITRLSRAGFVEVTRTVGSRAPSRPSSSDWPSRSRSATPASWPLSRRPSSRGGPGPGIFSGGTAGAGRPSKPWCGGPYRRAAGSSSSIPRSPRRKAWLRPSRRTTAVRPSFSTAG